MIFEDEDNNAEFKVNERKKSLNFTATEHSYSFEDQSNNSVYLKKDILKDRLAHGGRWQENLETTKQDTAGSGLSYENRVKHIDLSQFQ
jgi:hypothetical protein